MDVNWIQFGTLGFLSCSCGLVGVFLIFRQMTMLANAISHTVLLGIAVALLLSKSYIFLIGSAYPAESSLHHLSFTSIMIGSFIVAIVTVLTHQKLVTFFKIQAEISIGLILSGYFSLGIILITVIGRNSHIGLESIMGNADSLNEVDFFRTLFSMLLTLILTGFYFKPFVLTSFDSAFAMSVGYNTSYYDRLLLLLTSFIVMIGFKAVGSILILNYLVGVPLCVKKCVNRLRFPSVKKIYIGVILTSWILSFCTVQLASTLFSYYSMTISTGALSSTLLFIAYSLLRLMDRFKGELVPDSYSGSTSV